MDSWNCESIDIWYPLWKGHLGDAPTHKGVLTTWGLDEPLEHFLGQHRFCQCVKSCILTTLMFWNGKWCKPVAWYQHRHAMVKNIGDKCNSCENQPEGEKTGEASLDCALYT